MSVCRWGCVWQMSPGGRWSRVEGVRESGPWRHLNQRRRAGAGSGVACTQRDKLSHDAEQRYHGNRCVCVGVIHPFFKLDSAQTHWSVGGIFFNMLGGTGNDLVLWAAACLYWFLFHCFSGEILHNPAAPHTVTLKEKVFLFYLFASS